MSPSLQLLPLEVNGAIGLDGEGCSLLSEEQIA